MVFNRSRKKILENAKHLLHMADKVLKFRSDILAQGDIKEIELHVENLKNECKGSKDVKLLKELIAKLDKVLRKVGKGIYPMGPWAENIEIFLVASILAIGIRAFFLQPFKIPTNSMFPSFSGMRPKVYQRGEPHPEGIERAWQFIKEGSSFYSAFAKDSGTLKIPLFERSDPLSKMGNVKFEVVRGRELFGLWLPFLLPKPYRLYKLIVGGEPVEIRVPFEFAEMESILHKAYFSNYKSFLDAVGSMRHNIISDFNGTWLHTNKYFEKDEDVLRFEILAGDMLFVDKMSYHFSKPKRGDSVVFRTNNISRLADDKYYIKRLVGTGGDIVAIRGKKLFVNWEDPKGSVAFHLNNTKFGMYPGYVAKGNLKHGSFFHVPQNKFYVLGDNSPYSYDSRYWGTVPEKEVVGKAFFVLHPFSWRWGKAK